MAEEEAMIKWFPEIDKNSVSVVGGKGANLGEIYNLGIPVPPGFVITARAYSHFIKENNLDEKISNLLKEIKYEDTAQLDKIAEEIRNLITNGKIPKDLTEEILESYENLGAKPSREGGSVEDILGENEEIPVAVRSSSTAEDLAEASFAGQQETYLNIRGEKELLKELMPNHEGETWCISKHLLSSTMRLIEVGNKLSSDDKKDEAKKMFERAYKVYSIFWALKLKLIDGQLIKDTVKTSSNLEDLVGKLADCCNE